MILRKTNLLIFCYIFSFLNLINASTLVTLIAPDERECYYTEILNHDDEITFYFSVLSGGKFDIDYEVMSPTGEIINSGRKRKFGEFVFQNRGTGDYSFCFENGMSTFAEKKVEFEIISQKDRDSSMHINDNQVLEEHEHITSQTINRISPLLDGMISYLRYIKVREWRNMGTVKSTESRIVYFSVISLLMSVFISGAQVTIVQLFFRGSRRPI